MKRELFSKKHLIKWIINYCLACFIVTSIISILIIVFEKRLDIDFGNSIAISIFYFCMACCMGVFVILTFQRQSTRIVIGFLIYLGFILLFALAGPPIFKLLKQDSLYNQFLLFILGGLLLSFSILFKEYLDTTKNAPFLLASLATSKPKNRRVIDYLINIPSPNPNDELYIEIKNQSSFAIVLRKYSLISFSGSHKKQRIETHFFDNSIFMDQKATVNLNIKFYYDKNAKSIESLYFYVETNCKYIFKYLLVFSELKNKKQNYFLDYEIV